MKIDRLLGTPFFSERMHTRFLCFDNIVPEEMYPPYGKDDSLVHLINIFHSILRAQYANKSKAYSNNLDDSRVKLSSLLSDGDLLEQALICLFYKVVAKLQRNQFNSLNFKQATTRMEVDFMKRYIREHLDEDSESKFIEYESTKNLDILWKICGKKYREFYTKCK